MTIAEIREIAAHIAKRLGGKIPLNPEKLIETSRSSTTYETGRGKERCRLAFTKRGTAWPREYVVDILLKNSAGNTYQHVKGCIYSADTDLEYAVTDIAGELRALLGEPDAEPPRPESEQRKPTNKRQRRT